MMTNRIQDKAASAWAHAGHALGIKVVAPYEFRSNNVSFDCLAYLPHFGGPKGMVILGIKPPDFEADHAALDSAREAGLYASSVNMEKYYEFDEVLFADTLRDWGYFGERSEAPTWLHGTGQDNL